MIGGHQPRGRGHDGIVAAKQPQLGAASGLVDGHAGCNSTDVMGEPAEVDAEQLLEVLRTEFRKRIHPERMAELDARITTLQQDLAATEELLFEAERQSARLASLYAAAYQLHSLDPTEINAALSEIAVDLLGARRCVLLMTASDRPGSYDVFDLVAGSLGAPPFESPIYAGGVRSVDACLADGTMRIAQPGSSVVAAVPLTMQGDVVGALVVIELLPQKPALKREDGELLDLLAAHAASALVGARVFQDTQRKLRTLEGLVALLRRGPGGSR